MDKRLRFLSVLVVIATLITFSRVVAAGEVGQGKAPRTNCGNSAKVPEVASETWDQPETWHQPAEFYGVAVIPAVYFVNFLLLYMANPNEAANMPAYRAPIPKALSDCLKKNPAGCSYFKYALSFDNNAKGKKSSSWPTECQTDPKLEQLAPSIARRPDQINEPLGLDRANMLAGLLNMDKSMILTDEGYECTIGTPPRDYPRNIILGDVGAEVARHLGVSASCVNRFTSSGKNQIRISTFIRNEISAPTSPRPIYQSAEIPEISNCIQI